MVKSVVIPLNHEFVQEIAQVCVGLGVRIVDFAPYGNAPFGMGGVHLKQPVDTEGSFLVCSF